MIPCMELDHLKSIWQKKADAPDISQQKLLDMLNQPSSGPVASMKRNVRFEFISSLFVYGLSALLFFLWDRRMYWEVALTFVVLGLLFSVYYGFKMRLLNHMQCLTCAVKSHLQKQLRTLEKYVRLYFWVGTLVVPAMLIYFGWLGFHKKELYGLPSKFGSFSAIALPYIAVTLLITVLLYFGNKTYVKRMYGKHIAHLKSVVQEMNEE